MLIPFNLTRWYGRNGTIDRNNTRIHSNDLFIYFHMCVCVGGGREGRREEGREGGLVNINIFFETIKRQGRDGWSTHENDYSKTGSVTVSA